MFLQNTILVLYSWLYRPLGKNRWTYIALFSYPDALLEIKCQYFAGEELEGLEPTCWIISVADGTAKWIGHFISASVYHGGPGPGFLAPWIYKYIACGLQEELKHVSQAFSIGYLYCRI